MTRLLALALVVAALLLPAPLLAEQGDTLERAWRLELDALHQELAALREQQDRAGRDLDAERERLQDALDRSRSRLSGLQLEAALEEDRLIDLEAARAGTSSGEELLAVALDQALVTLRRRDRPIAGADELEDPQLLEAVLASSGELLAEQASVRTTPGSFFLADGRQVDGELTRVGEVAVLGLAGEHGGPLAPAGGGEWRLADDDAAAVRAWLGAEGAPLLHLFLLDPVSRQEARALRPGAWEKVLSGGPLVWPILALGLLALLVILERVRTLRRLHTRTDELLDEVLELGRADRWGEATDRCRRTRGAPSRILLAGLRGRDMEKQLLDDVLSEAIVREMPTLERFMPILSVTAAVAPLLGLLGTVTGMISTFEVITEHGTGDPQMLSGGISVALVTTQLGLAVAIPVLLAQSLLSAFIEHLVGDMQKGALTLANALHRLRAAVVPGEPDDGEAT